MARGSESRLVIGGLGPGSPEEVPSRVIQRCLEACKVFVRTERHPSVSVLRTRGISYISFDSLYESSEDYSTLYERMADEVLDSLGHTRGMVVYLVPGNPMVAERSVEILLSRVGTSAEIIGARSFAEVALEATGVPAPAGYCVLDAYELREAKTPPYYTPNIPHVIGQVHDVVTASWVKLYLLEFLPPETRVFLVSSAGIRGSQRVVATDVASLDTEERFDHLTTLVVPPVGEERARTLGTWVDLLSVVARLRGEHGCPWDKQQTHETLVPFTIEEAYELATAIRQGDLEAMVEELGDLLLQIALHVQIGREKKEFDDVDVVSTITRKLIARHPHVFGNDSISSPEEVARKWEELKKKERNLGDRSSLMDSLTPGLPALVMAQKQQVLAASVGFDWKTAEGVMQKVHEELDELRRAVRAGDKRDIGEEIGDLLYAVVNLSRHLGHDAETCLRASVDKFSRRFRAMERLAAASGLQLGNLDEKSLDDLWNAAKAWKDLEQEHTQRRDSDEQSGACGSNG